MNTQGVSRRLLWPGFLALLLLCLALPAHAGPQGKKFRTDTSDTSSETTAPSTGDINPTSAPVVDDDFAGLELTAVKEEPTLLDAAQLSAYVDKELLYQLDAPTAHRVAQGRGVVVAVLDAGFLLHHPAVCERMLPDGWDFVDGDPDPEDLGNGLDDDGDGWVDRGVGHGTMVAAMVLTAAPEASILPLRVRDDEGKGSDYAILAALEYAIGYGVDVINLSVDHDIYDDARLPEMIKKAKSHGIVVVSAAGNDGLTELPAGTVMAASLIVAAVDRQDVVAPFSNYTTDRSQTMRLVCAPGVDLVGPLVGEGFYARGSWSGTSFAAGLVSGAAALVKERHPSWGPAMVRDAVLASVVPVCTPNGRRLRTAGRVDLAQVVTK